MGLKEWIIPQDAKFFDLLDKIAANGVDAANALMALMDDYKDVPAKRKAIKAFEHRGDELVHDMYGMLNRSFITPIDHADFTALLTGLDDFVDYIDASANRFALYEIPEPTPGMKSMARLIVRQAQHLQQAVKGLRTLSKPKDVERACIEVHTLENAADGILNESIAALFRTTDPVGILKNKEVYEYLETATDKAEDAANIIGDIVMKNA